MKKFLVAAMGSGSGKTTVSMILMKLFSEQMSVQAFKVGPDFIDPTFHRRVLGIPSYNLDPYFLQGKLKSFFEEKSQSDLSIVEGVMGYYDGLSMGNTQGSTYEVAKTLDLPVILVVNPKGMATSIIAQIQGYCNYVPDSKIKGIILTPCKKSHYEYLKDELEIQTGLRLLGYLEPFESIPSRHLGLVQANELQEFESFLESACTRAKETLLLSEILSLAKNFSTRKVIPKQSRRDLVICYASDEAFSFYYPENLEILEKMGARLVPFSPMFYSELPPCDAIYLGGGYPELHAKELSENKTMLDCIRNEYRRGTPIFAECGGYLYLMDELEDDKGESYPQLGIINTKGIRKESILPFGYAEISLREDCLMGKKGDTIRAHEFHYWKAEVDGTDLRKIKKGKESLVGVTSPTLFASFMHLHFMSNPNFAKSFIENIRINKK